MRIMSLPKRLREIEQYTAVKTGVALPESLSLFRHRKYKLKAVFWDKTIICITLET